MSQITGLISGMDTQSLIADLMKIEKKSVTRLENQYTSVDLKKTVYKNVISQMEAFQKNLLNLKLESTFKAKKVNSSNSDFLTGTAGVSSIAKSYSIKIDQLAQSSLAMNSFSKTALNSNGNTTNISSISGNANYNIDGKYKVNLLDKGTYTQADYSLTLDKKSIIQKTQGGIIEGTTANTIASNINKSNNRLNITYGDKTFDITLDFAQANSTKISDVTNEIQKKVNTKLNELNNTKNETYVMVNYDNPNGASNGSIAFYNVKEGNSNTISINNDGGPNLANASLGLSSTTSLNVNSVTKTLTASSFTALSSTMNSNNFLDGYSVSTMNGLQQGSAELSISKSVNPASLTKTKIDGGNDVSTTTANLFTTGLNNAGLKTAITGVQDSQGKTNAVFTINDVKITLNDIDNLTMNDALAIINGSGAGVTASYDSINDRFSLAANGNATTIKLGNYADTSNFLSATKIAITAGGTLYQSNSASNIEATTALYQNNFGKEVKSGTISINGVSIYVNRTDTLNDIIKRINNSSADVIATYDKNSDKFTLQSKMGEVDSNEKLISIGSSYDTSNFFELVGVTQGVKSSVKAESLSGNLAADTIKFVANGTSENITLNATNGTGAYTDNLNLDFTTGITAGTKFMIMGGSDGTTQYFWENNSGKTIYSMDDLIKEWNNTDNWTDSLGNSTNVQVKMGSTGENQVRLFNKNGGTNASFTIFNDVGADISQLGLLSGATQNQHLSATADSVYNSLSIAYDIGWKFGFGEGGLNVTADGIGGINFESQTQGVDGMFSFEDISGNTVSNIFKNGNRSSNYEEVGFEGVDAKFTVDGVDYVTSTNSVDNVLGDVKLQLNNKTTSVINFDVEIDSDKVLTQLTDFIYNYNKMIEKLNPDRLTKEQKKYLEPLTSEQKNEMLYTELEDYEEKYKLYNEYNIILKDSALGDFSYSMRQMVNGIVEGMETEFSSLDTIGIKVGSTGLQADKNKGLLLFSQESTLTDEEYKEEILKNLKENTGLLDVIKNNSDELYKLFGNNSETNSSISDGIARALDKKTNEYIKRGGILKERVVVNGSFDKELQSIYEQIEFYKERNDKKEEALYNQFARMETQLSKLQADSTNFLSQMGLSNTSS